MFDSSFPPCGLAGVCWLLGHPLPGDQRQERHQCRAGVHDHGSRDQEAHGPRGHSWRRQAQLEDRQHPCQAVRRGLLLKDPPPSAHHLNHYLHRLHWNLRLFFLISPIPWLLPHPQPTVPPWHPVTPPSSLTCPLPVCLGSWKTEEETIRVLRSENRLKLCPV